MTTEEGELEAGDDSESVSTEHVDDTSLKISDSAVSCSSVAAGTSVTIDQMVRDFIIAKAIGMNSCDRVSDSVKAEQVTTKQQHHKKKKRKKKKKKHKSQHKESSSKHRHRRHHRDRKSSDSSSKSDSSDDDRHCTNDAEVVTAEDKVTRSNHCTKNEETAIGDDSLTLTRKKGETVNSDGTKEASQNVCSKCHSSASDDQKTTANDIVQCHCLKSSKDVDTTDSKNEAVLPVKRDDMPAKLTANKSRQECDRSDGAEHTSALVDRSVKETGQLMSVDSQHSRESTRQSHKDSISSYKHSAETRKLIKQDNRHKDGVSSKSRQHVDDKKSSPSAERRHSSRERRSSRDSSACRKRSSFEGVLEKQSALSDDVVFVKKVPAHDKLKSSSCREVATHSEKSNREQKLSRENSQSVAVVDGKRSGSKRRYDSGSSDEVISVPQSKTKKNGRNTKESSVISVSDDDVDILSDELAEKLHKRLTTSIQKSKELQANMKNSKPTASCDIELIEEEDTNRSDAADTHSFAATTSECSEITLPNDSVTSHGEAANAAEQSAAKSTASGLLGKKTLKFGLKISESSAAWISKGIKSNHASGTKSPVCCLFVL